MVYGLGKVFINLGLIVVLFHCALFADRVFMGEVWLMFKINLTLEQVWGLRVSFSKGLSVFCSQQITLWACCYLYTQGGLGLLQV